MKDFFKSVFGAKVSPVMVAALLTLSASTVGIGSFAFSQTDLSAPVRLPPAIHILKGNVLGLSTEVAASASQNSSQANQSNSTTTPVIKVLSIIPNSGTGYGPQNFSVSYSDTAGASDIRNALIAFQNNNITWPSYANSCTIDFSNGYFYLKNNSGSSWLNIGVLGSGTATNNQCTVSTYGTTLSASGTALTLHNILVSFQPSWAGSKSDWLQAGNGTQTSGWKNDGSWTVPGISQTPPSISISPTGFGFSISLGYSASSTLTISNVATGTAQSLTWNIGTTSIPSWLNISPLSGSVAQFKSSFVVITVNTANLAGGNYSYNMALNSNDPQHPTISVPITLEAGGGPTNTKITTTSLTDAIVNTQYNFQLMAINMLPGDYWSLGSSSTLPIGLTLSSTGMISGVPTTVTTIPDQFTVEIINQYGIVIASQALSLSVDMNGMKITTTSLPDASVNQPYTYQLLGTNIPINANWILASGSLPSGISLNPTTGLISGTPTVVTNSPDQFTVEVYSGISEASQALSLTVLSYIPTNDTKITTTSLTDAVANVPYSFTLEGVNIPNGATWGLLTGSLPIGLSLNPSSGLIFGTPTVATNGADQFTVGIFNGILLAFQPLSLTVDVGTSPSYANVANVSSQINSQGSVLPDGSLIKGSGPEIYIIDHGYKYGITSLSTFYSLGLKLSNVVKVTDSVLSSYPDGGVKN
jgi:hypothetical protein